MIDKRRLRRAIERGQIFPVFHPIVTLPVGAVAGFEVLARWQDDEMGAVPPSRFIPVAERAGLMAPLTTHLMETACTAARQWGGRFQLAFNISPVQFRDAALPAQIEAAIRRTGFPFPRILLEITESALIDDLETARSLIARLKALGMRIALDDFGTGFSSLTRLQALPFDRIKIDASFVRTMTTSRGSRKIVSAIIGLGQSLGMAVIAEGIETVDEARMLTRLGCDFGQGYLFGRPSLAKLARRILNSRGESACEILPRNLSCNLRLAQLNAIYATAPFALCFIDMSRRFVSANERFAALIGIGLNDIVGRRVDDMSPDSLPMLTDILGAAANGNVLPPMESLAPDGRRILLSTVSPARDEDDEVVGISLAIVDITKYKSSTVARPFGRRPDGGFEGGWGG